MTTDTNKPATPNGSQDAPKKGTLSLGGTLSVGGAGAAPSTPRPGAGVAVEVRRRRFDAPTQQPRTPAKPAALSNEEMQRRMQALSAAQEGDTARQAQQNALKMASQLQEDRIKNAQQAKVQQQEAAQAQQAAEATRRADEEKRRQEVSTNKAGSGSGGVQSGTLTQGASHRAVDARDFTGRKPVNVDDARKRTTAGRPEVKDDAKKRGRNAYLGELEGRARGGKRKVGERNRDANAVPAEKVFREVAIPEFITVADLAARMTEKSADVVKKLMMMGEMVTANQTIDQATAELIVTEFGHTPKLEQEVDLESVLLEADDADKDLKARPPIVTVMGHVDHGKTTLLDSLRATEVAAGEAGGITQHIGAYQITAPSGRPITFLDTPGHAAFTAMRARGAQVTDVVILVVAADDGIMPQTREAIQHAKEAGVPMVVAINKIDKPSANPQRVKTELMSEEVVLEEYGGTVPAVEISALKRTGLEALEEIVLLQADVLDLKANPNRRADGTVVEARLDKGRGPIATAIVQRGTLKVGDIVVAGSIWGRVRALLNDKGENIKEAGPSMPVAILGLGGVPQAGDTFVVAENEKKAKDVAWQREQQQRERDQAARKMTLENLMEKMASPNAHELNVIIKADVQGSVEAIQYALSQLNDDQSDVRVKVISGGVGVINENDVSLATTSRAFVIGFNVKADATARAIAEQAGVELRYYNIIYNAVDDIKAAMSGLLAPTVQEEVTGTAEIRMLFSFGKTKIAGCMVTSGKLARGSKVRILRKDEVIYTGALGTLRRAKDDVKEVSNGYECGMTFEGFTQFHEGDIVEGYVLKEVKRTIDDLKALGQKQKAEKPAAEA